MSWVPCRILLTCFTKYIAPAVIRIRRSIFWIIFFWSTGVKAPRNATHDCRRRHLHGHEPPQQRGPSKRRLFRSPIGKSTLCGELGLNTSSSKLLRLPFIYTSRLVSTRMFPSQSFWHMELSIHVAATFNDSWMRKKLERVESRSKQWTTPKFADSSRQLCGCNTGLPQWTQLYKCRERHVRERPQGLPRIPTEPQKGPPRRPKVLLHHRE
jgi:hypothetical protein